MTFDDRDTPGDDPHGDDGYLTGKLLITTMSSSGNAGTNSSGINRAIRSRESLHGSGFTPGDRLPTAT